MSAKDVLTQANNARGIGTAIAQYAETGPYHCEDCVFLKSRTSPIEGRGLCRQRFVLLDPNVPTDKKTGLKSVSLQRGCCKFVKYPPGYVEETNEK